MEDQPRPHKDQDVAEASSQIGGGKGKLFQDQLPADGVEAKDQDSQAEPGDVSRRHKRMPAAELETRGSKAFHEYCDGRQEKNIAAFTQKFI